MTPNLQPTAQGAPVSQDDEIDLAQYLDVVLENRWLIAAVTALCIFFGLCYVYMSKPVYEADMLIQVEDGQSGLGNLLGDASDLFATKTAASAEMVILRSRLVVDEAVSNLKLYISAQPKYFPVVGRWLASRKNTLSDPGLFGQGGYVWGSEKIKVSDLSVPRALEGQDLVLTADGRGRYVLTSSVFEESFTGTAGKLEVFPTPVGELKIQVQQLESNAGGVFLVKGYSQLNRVNQLQGELVIEEVGKQSGVIRAKLQGVSPVLTAEILNEVGRQYVKQNVERRSAEAEKSLEFLEGQLPQLKRDLERSEDKYNALRNQRGTVNLGEEATIVLQQSVASRTKLFELQQQRQNLLTRFTPEHPSVKSLDDQIAAVTGEQNRLTGKIKELPNLEQDIVRLTRDVTVNTTLYATLLNNVQQLRVVKAGRIGSVRIVDDARTPEVPVAPQKGLILASSVLAGIVLGILVAFLRNVLFGGISAPQDIEKHTGLTVYATIPYSTPQKHLIESVEAGSKAINVLADRFPSDPAVESLRSLRTALQFATLNARNNIVLMSGPTPGVGKSFISVNFASVMAAAGRRVLLLDGDLRKGYLHRYFGMTRGTGFSELMAGSADNASAIHRSVLEGVDLITTGALPPNPGELLLSPRFSELMAQFAKEYDVVILDAPPVLVAADAGILAMEAATTFLVARAELTTVGELDESMKRLAHVGVVPTGVLFNGLSMSTVRYGYGGKYGRYRYTAYEYGSKS